MRPRRAPPAPPPPPPPGSGLREGGRSVEGEGTARAVLKRMGAGPGPDAAPLHLQYLPSPAVGPPGTRPPSSGWPPPPSGASAAERARRAARGGARGAPSLGPRRSRPRCPHFLPLPAGRAAWDGPGAPGSPELRAPLTPLSWPPLAHSEAGQWGTSRVCVPSQPSGQGGDTPRAEAKGQPAGTFAGIAAQRPTQADPGALPSRASPAPLSALSRRKQRLIRYPRPASQRRGNGRVAEGNRGGQRSGGARTASEGSSPITHRKDFEKSPRAVFQPGGKGQGIRVFLSCRTARSLCCFFPLTCCAGQVEIPG